MILAVIGWWVGVFLIYNQQKRRKLRQRLAWPVTNGNVTYAKIKHLKAKEGGDNLKPEEWTVYARFSYCVAGKTYSTSQDWSQNFKPYAYSSGEAIKIYYNPERPKEAVINPAELNDMWIGNWLFAAAGVVPILLFILFFTL